MSTKSVILAVVIIGIAGSIYVLERQKVDPVSTTSTEGSEINLEDVYKEPIPPSPCEGEGTLPGCGSNPSGLASSTDATSAIKPVAPPQEVVIDKSKKFEVAKEISTPDGFVNADSSFTVKSLIGKKIILVDFWTYSCINCQRTQPYLNAWYEKYKDKGLEIVGVHTPEFEFEKIFANVEKATRDAGITYPVVLDNDYSTWRAYKNQYWPRKYLIDIDGYIVYDHIGEGAYEETEKKIQQALEERMKRLNMQGAITSDTAKPTDVVGVDFSKVASPEIYFGSSRNDRLGNGTKFTIGTQTLEAPAVIQPNTLYLVGTWNIQPEYAEARSKNARVIFRYDARHMYTVASAPAHTQIFLTRDGNLTGSWVSKDAISSGGKTVINVQDERLYQLVDGESYGPHTIEINISEVGVKFFTFTFG